MRRNGDSRLISDIYLDSAISEVATRRSEFAAIPKKDGLDGLFCGPQPQGRHPHCNHGESQLGTRCCRGCQPIFRGRRSATPRRLGRIRSISEENHVTRAQHNAGDGSWRYS